MQSEEKPNVLIVDDVTANLTILEHILNSLDINIIKANSGKTALKYVNTHDFAVIILDIQMPEIDGFETAELIRKNEHNLVSKRQIPIIFVTACDSENDYIFRSYSLGAVDYLIKPIHPEVLKAKVTVLVELYKNTEKVKRQAKQLEAINKKLEIDIIERQQVQTALRESEERFRSAFDYAAIGMALVGLDGCWLKVNNSLCEIVGYSDQELLATNFQSITHPDDLDSDLNYIQKLLSGELRSYQMEKRYFHKLGHVVWILLTGSLIRDSQGNPLYFIAQIQDISERKLNEERVLKLAAIVESSDDAIISETLEGVNLSWNHGAEKLYGYSIEEINQETRLLLIPLSHADELPRILDTIKQGGRFDNYETVRVRKDGEHIDVSLTISPIKDANDIIIGVATIARNISDRKRIEETIKRLWHQNELILNSAGEGICGLDLHGRIKFINPAAAKMLGYEVMELIYQPIHPIFTNSQTEIISCPLEDSLIYTPIKEGKVHHVINTVFWRKDGSSFPVEYMSTPIREEDIIVGVVLTFKDISERLVIEQMKQEFVSVVSHELRTPLTSIRGALGMLVGGLLKSHPDKAQRMLEIAVTNTDRLVRLINDILDIERIESGQVNMEKKSCDAADLIMQATEVMQSMAEKAKVTLSVTTIPAKLWADPDRIIQTLTNLLSNAIKFSPPNTTVWINAEQKQKEIWFEIKDQGRGIPTDKLESVFGRFQQVDASDSRQKGGTGLGLAICRSIIQQHSGKIWVESELGVGSTFYITLPTLTNIREDIADTRPLLLLCDDDPIACVMVNKLMAKRGYRVVTVTSGEEALDIATREQPDVILLDLIMPGMNGWETMDALKQSVNTKNIPIIMFSALSMEEIKFPHPEVLDWVQKPLDEVSLFETLEQCLQRQAKVAKVLLVEDDLDLAWVINTIFERHNIQTFHAQTGRQAIELSQEINIDLLVLDLGLPEYDGFAVVDWLRQYDRLREIPLVVYSAKDLDNAERERLRLGQTEFLTKGRIAPEEFEQRIIALLNRIIPNQKKEIVDCDKQTSSIN